MKLCGKDALAEGYPVWQQAWPRTTLRMYGLQGYLAMNPQDFGGRPGDPGTASNLMLMGFLDFDTG